MSSHGGPSGGESCAFHHMSQAGLIFDVGQPHGGQGGLRQPGDRPALHQPL
jgi:hypothetical protein